MAAAGTPIEGSPEVETIFAVCGASAVRAAIGTVYFSFAHWLDSPLVVLDWDVQTLESTLPTYCAQVFARLAVLRAACRVVMSPEDMALYCEPEGLGQVVMIEAYKTGYDVRAVQPQIAELDLEDRTTPALVYVHAGQVKLSRHAFDKTANFRGTAANHLRRQIENYKKEQDADDAELLTAWCTGILMALETGR
jgi:hypothetical protein